LHNPDAKRPNPAAGKYPIAAAVLALLLAGVIMPSPLYELYRRNFNLTPAEITLVFAIYALSLIPSLIFLGGISDQIGRRRTMLVGIVLLALGSLVLAFADGLIWLIIARVLQGLAMGVSLGAAIAAITEWMTEKQRKHASQVVVISTGVGAAFGALLGGILGQYSTQGSTLPYLIHIALLIVVGAAVATVPSCPHVHPSLHSSVLRVPSAIRRPFFIASGQTFISWGTIAIFLSLVPTFLNNSLDLHNLVVGALVVAVIQLGSILASLVGERLGNRQAIIVAMLVLGAGMWSLLLSEPTHAHALVGIGALLVGVANGLSYLAGLRIIQEIAPPDHRAEVTSAFLVASYSGFSLPALAVGFAANYIGLYPALVVAAIALGVIALTVIALTTERNLKAPTPAAT